jgi:hypothetical protein
VLPEPSHAHPERELRPGGLLLEVPEHLERHRVALGADRCNFAHEAHQAFAVPRGVQRGNLRSQVLDLRTRFLRSQDSRALAALGDFTAK